MTTADILDKDLHFALAGMPAGALDCMTIPGQDPARKLPDGIADAPPPAGSGDNVPTVEEIEAVLVAHVRGGAAPRHFIENLLHPFGASAFITLLPGQGQKRMTYALDVMPYGLVITRSSVRSVAEQLHGIASRLARHQVGERAPETAQTYDLEVSEWNTYQARVTIPAADAATARRAYISAFGRRPAAVHVRLDYTALDLVPHILAARSLLAADVIGTPAARERAVALIAATQDLRAAATTILRRIPDIRSYDMHWIGICPSAEEPIEVINKNPTPVTAHEKMQFLARYRGLIDALARVVRRNSVLASLPASWRIRMTGEPKFLSLEIIDTKEGQSSPRRTLPSSLFEYACVRQLAERLSEEEAPDGDQDAYWRLEISGRCRSKRTWNLNGPTLTHAIAREVREDGARASMVLFDLLIDLLGDEEGVTPEVHLHRVLHDA